MFFRKRNPLAVEWSQSGKVRGLLQGRLTLPVGVAAGDVRLRIDGREVPLQGENSANDGAMSIKIHTHLLANGKHTIDVVAHLPGKSADSISPAVIEVNNIGRLAERVSASLRRSKSPIAFVGDCDSSYYDYRDASLQPWFDREDAGDHIDRLLAAGEINSVEAEALRGFVRDGFLILPEGLPAELVTRARADMDRAAADGYQGYRYGDSTRLEQMHVNFPAIREIWLHDRVHRLLGILFGEESQPCQSLGYVFGSQQDAHQDTIHLTPFPAGYMCGVWVALEDVCRGSGELLVYPGSHRLPRVYLRDTGCRKVRGDWSQFGQTVVKRWEALVRDSGLKPVPYLAKAGSVLIWHENLMHAGSVRADKSLSRRSIVTHNFARGAIVYYDSTGMIGYAFSRTVNE